MLTIGKKHLRRLPIIVIGLGLFILYMLWVVRRPRGVFWSLDEGGKFIYLQNVLRTGDPRAPLIYIGHSVDPDLKFVPLYFWNRKENCIFPWWPVSFPLISLPFYKLLGWTGLYVLPALGGALTSVLSGILMQELKPSSRTLPFWTVLITGLTTPIAFYSTVFWEHTLSTALSIGLVLSAVLAVQNDDWRWLVIGGGAGAIATFFRTETVPIVLGTLIIIFLYRKPWAFYLAIGIGIAYSVLLALNRALSGEFLGSQAGSLIRLPFFLGLSRAGWLFLPSILFNTALVLAYPIPTWMLIGGSICIVVIVIGVWIKQARWVIILSIFGIGLLSAFVLFQPYGYRSVHGFVLIAPHVVFVAWLYPLKKSHLQRMFGWMLVSSGMLCGLAYVTRAWLAAGGLQWGPRYLLSFYPLCIVGGLLALERLPNFKQLSRYFLIGLYIFSALLGLGYQIRGAYALWYTTHLFQEAWHQIESLEADALVTPCTWMPMVIPSLYWDRPIFAVHNEEDLRQWSKLASRAGLKKAYLVDMAICMHIPLHEVAQWLKDYPDGVIAYQFEPGENDFVGLFVKWR